MSLNLDLEYLYRAYQHARTYSRDMRTQNGAILRHEDGRETFGANHFPRGVDENLDRWGRDQKLSWVEHSERNAIYEAARLGRPTQGGTLYCPWFACCDCARGIIQSGIVRVVGHNAPFHNARPDWKPLIDRADTMLREAGVKFERLDFKFKGIKILFDGVEVEP